MIRRLRSLSASTQQHAALLGSNRRPLLRDGARVFSKKVSSDPKDVPYESSIHRSGEECSDEMRLPAEVDAVVIGAGSLGCSVAYHLGKFKAGKVLLLEKHRVTSGTTWHTAGSCRYA